MAEAADLPGRVIVAELDLDLMLSLAGEKVVAASLSGYPGRDAGRLARGAADVPAAEVRAALVEGAGELLESLRLVDDYRGRGCARRRRRASRSRCASARPIAR